MKLDRRSAFFLDTTFLLPFFQININVEAFTLDGFKEFIIGLSEVHFSELSIFEAKAKIYRLSRRSEAYTQALKEFGENLTILREDEKFIFHPYTKDDDEAFNLLASKNLGLDSFDALITAQALSIGVLISEDKEILNMRKRREFLGDPTLRKMMIKRWKELKT